MLIVRFVHYLGMAMWIGGWLAVVLLASYAGGESQRFRVSLAALLARVQIAFIGPGALLTVASGILWSMAIAGSGGVESRVTPLGVWIMTAGGVVGGLLVAVSAIPTAVKVKAVAVTSEDGRVLPVFERLDRRLRVVSAAAGLCALVSLFGAVLVP